MSRIITWYGLRYAAPPTGVKRWRAPNPIAQYGGYRSSCHTRCLVSRSNLFPTWLLPISTSIGGQEDGLTVDVLVPDKPAASKLPVFVEIHRGGYTTGSAPTTPGYAMVNQSKGNLIFVQVQYRLGAFGFLNSPEVRQDGTANAGLLDQRLAMDWAQKYIANFGGDPQRVTVHGGSAGGGSVTNQIILDSGASRPPFRYVIAGELTDRSRFISALKTC